MASVLRVRRRALERKMETLLPPSRNTRVQEAMASRRKTQFRIAESKVALFVDQCCRMGLCSL